MAVENWISIRSRARAVRSALKRDGATPTSVEALQAAVAEVGLSIVPVVSGDPLLGGARSALDLRAGIIAVDESLPEETKQFAIAHEVGHRHLHVGSFRCEASDVDEAPLTERLPFGEGKVETYNPRQRREVEASVFAAEFLMPGPLLRERLLAGERLASLAASLGVSETALLNQLAATLLAAPEPPVSSESSASPSPRLDPTQLAAAEAPTGPLLVDAGPGTGKTRTLTGRVRFLVEKGISGKPVAPEAILVLTFSNRATQELRERLEAALPRQAHAITIGTFHGFCLELLRRYAPESGLPADMRIVDPVDAEMMLERQLGDLKLVEYADLHTPGRYIKPILRAISRAKDELAGPDRYLELAEAMVRDAQTDDQREAAAKAVEVARVYRYYEEMLARQGLVDFGDLIGKAVRLLEEHEDVRRDLQIRYRHILVDEYQDVNRASAVLLLLLAGDGRGLWAVGDLRQSIYRFRGASPANIGRFEEDFPGGQRKGLELNYRSVQPLVELFEAAATLVAVGGKPPRWQASRGEGSGRVSAIRWAEAPDDQAEVEGIAAAIKAHRAAKIGYAQQAVLCRTNGQAAALAAALEDQEIPVAYFGDLFKRAEIRDLLMVLSLAAEADGNGLVRAATIPDHLIAPDDVAAILGGARAAGYPFPKALIHADEYAGVSPAGVVTAKALGRRLSAISYGRDAWQFLALYLFAEGNYVARLLADGKVKSQQALLALGQLLLLARTFATRPLADAGEEVKRAFLGYVRHLIATDDDRVQAPASLDSLEAVRILTAHTSKGLEFPAVFVPNLAQQRFPPQKSWDPAPPPPGLLPPETVDSEMVEEQCLLFVAMSRARDALVLSRAERYGKMSRKPSPLWGLVEGHLKANGIVPEKWGATVSGKSAATPPKPPASDGRIELSISAVETYVNCPREYYYRRVLSLPERGEELGYKRFHDCVRESGAWLRDRVAQDGVVPGWDEVLASLDATWALRGPVDHLHEAAYRVTANEMLQRLRQELAAGPVAVAWRREVVVEMPHCRLRVGFDHSEVSNGEVRLVRYRTGRPRDKHRSEPRLALYREAGRQHAGGLPVVVELRYLSDGSRVVVPPQPRYEPDRLAKLDAAAIGIVGGEFPSKPSEADHCARCPYILLCSS